MQRAADAYEQAVQAVQAAQPWGAWADVAGLAVVKKKNNIVDMRSGSCYCLACPAKVPPKNFPVTLLC